MFLPIHEKIDMSEYRQKCEKQADLVARHRKKGLPSIYADHILHDGNDYDENFCGCGDVATINGMCDRCYSLR